MGDGRFLSNPICGRTAIPRECRISVAPRSTCLRRWRAFVLRVERPVFNRSKSSPACHADGVAFRRGCHRLTAFNAIAVLINQPRGLKRLSPTPAIVRSATRNKAREALSRCAALPERLTEDCMFLACQPFLQRRQRLRQVAIQHCGAVEPKPRENLAAHHALRIDRQRLIAPFVERKPVNFLLWENLTPPWIRLLWRLHHIFVDYFLPAERYAASIARIAARPSAAPTSGDWR